MSAEPSSMYPVLDVERVEDPESKWIPLAVRMKLDLCGRKIRLPDWTALRPEDREALLRMPAEVDSEVVAFEERLGGALREVGRPTPKALETKDAVSAWRDSAAIPDRVACAAARCGVEVPWALCDRFARFVLCHFAARDDDARFAAAAVELKKRAGDATTGAAANLESAQASAGISSPGTLSAGCVRGVLLAGGASRRFGSDKRRALLGNETMFERCLGVLRAAVEGPVLVAAGDRREGLVLGPRDEFIPDQVARSGPLGALVEGLVRSPTGVLVLACDLPSVTPDLLGSILRKGIELNRPVAPRVDGRWEPLVAFYPGWTLTAMDAGLREGRRAVHRLLEALDPVALEDVRVEALRNINRPEDLEKL